MLCIVINSICMASFDYIADNKCAYEKIHSGGCKIESSLNKSLGYAGQVFLFIFFVEALIKLFSLGAFCGFKTYFKDPWNILDFIIVVSGLIEFILETSNSTAGINLKGFRTLRVLRPLKGLKTIPSLRKQVAALFRSMKGLANVMIFLCFIFLIFGIVGL